MTSKRPDRLLTPNEVADILQIPKRTLDQWRWLGKGPAFRKIGAHVRYEQRALDAWIEEQ